MSPDPDPTPAAAPATAPESEAGGDRFGRHVSMVSGLTLASRLLGFARDCCFGWFFIGRAAWVSDAFLSAFTVPNLFRGLLGEGALSASFLPPFVAERERGDAAGLARLAGQALGNLAAFAGAIAAAGALLALVLGFVFSASAPFALMLRLTALMFPFMPLVCGTALLAAMLQGMRRFAFPAALSTLLNLAFLAAFAWIYFGLCGGDLDRLAGAAADPGAAGAPATKAAYALAVAVLAAGAAQIVLAWGRLAALGVPARPSLRRDHPGIARALRAFGPAALGVGVVQANVFLDMTIAYALSFKAPGAKTFLHFGNQLMHLPLALFATAVASTAFPYFARHHARGEHADLLARLGRTLRMALLVTVPAGIGLAVVADPVARLLFQRPDLTFSHVDVYRTGLATTFYALGLPWFAAQMILVRWLYARGDYRAPVRIAVRMVALNLVLNLSLVFAPDFLRLWTPAIPENGFLAAADLPLWRGGYAASFGLSPGDFPFGARLGESGLALATALTAAVHVVLLGFAARRSFLAAPGAGGARAAAEAWKREAGAVFAGAWRMLVAALGMGLLTHWFVNSIPYEPELPARLERALVPVGLGALAYAALGMVVPVPEIEAAFRRVFRRGRGPRPDAGGDRGPQPP